MRDDAGFLATLVQHAPLGVAFIDLDFRFRIVNEALASINGLPPEQHIGRTVAEVVPAIWPQLEPIYRRVIETGKAVTDLEISGQVASTPGETRHWLTAYYPLRGSGGAMIGIGAMTVELTEQRQAEANYRAMLSALPDFVFELASDGTHRNFHAPREEALFVPPERILGRRVREILPADVADQYERHIAETLRHGAMQVFEYVLSYPDAGNKAFEARMVRKSDDEVLVIVRDISDRRRAEQERRVLEEQFRQAQKMEAVGQLAGGVAHDFNNLLTIINAYSEMVLESLPDKEPAKALVADIRKAGDRAATLTRQLLLFSRQQVLEPKVLDLNSVVGDAERMLRRLIGEDVQFETRLAPGLRPVLVDQGQIEQALLNLCVNARDAMPTGGTITIETRNITIADGPAFAEARPGDYALLSVSDTGTGMDEITKSRLFEPFFTTKGPGKGTGLGLAVVFGVVKQSGGHVEVTTAPGRGTTFRLYFPQVAAVAPTADRPPAAPSVPSGSETVLLVEDDPGVRTLAHQILQRRGYTVIEASNGLDAIRLLEGYSGPLHLVISDVVMPHFGGRRLAELVLALRPGVRVLFLSGYTDDAVVRHGVLGAEFAFLQKPFTPATLATKVREVLDAPM